MITVALMLGGSSIPLFRRGFDIGDGHWVSALFDRADFADTTGMAAAFEVGFKPGLDDPIDNPWPQHIRRQAQDVRVVVSPADTSPRFHHAPMPHARL